jgi:uncharacterized protein YoxC
MSETTILVLSIATLAIVMVVVGIYSIIVLGEFRQTLRRVNKILGNTETISDSVAGSLKPAGSLAGIVTVLRDGLAIVHEMRELARETRSAAHTVSQEAQTAARTAATEVRQVAHETMQEIRQPESVAHDIAPEHRFFRKH